MASRHPDPGAAERDQAAQSGLSYPVIDPVTSNQGGNIVKPKATAKPNQIQIERFIRLLESCHECRDQISLRVFISPTSVSIIPWAKAEEIDGFR